MKVFSYHLQMNHKYLYDLLKRLTKLASVPHLWNYNYNCHIGFNKLFTSKMDKLHIIILLSFVNADYYL